MSRTHRTAETHDAPLHAEQRAYRTALTGTLGWAAMAVALFLEGASWYLQLFFACTLVGYLFERTQLHRQLIGLLDRDATEAGT